MLFPLYSRVLVEIIPEEKTPSGLILTKDKEIKEVVKGKVLQIGKGRRENGKWIPLMVGVGDTVLFQKFTGDQIDRMDETLFMVDEGHILAIERTEKEGSQQPLTLQERKEMNHASL